MNEFEIINEIIKRDSHSGIGDDCSVIEHSATEYLVTTTDLLVENTHFCLSTTDLKSLGYKALAVNISDIAAMAARPKWAHLSLAIPSSISEEQIKEFFTGFYELADQYKVKLMGGDLSDSKSDFFISLTLSGIVGKEKIKRRSAFKPGDRLFVTGSLGDSAVGLRILENKIQNDFLTRKHLRPGIHLEKALVLGESPRVHGMMDLSDGLISDLERASEASGCGFDVDIEKLPLSKEFKIVCQEMSWDPLELALAGGEDYCLLFSADQSFQDSNIYEIGRVNESGIRFLDNGKVDRVNYRAFSHF